MRYSVHSVIETFTEGANMRNDRDPEVSSNSDELKEEKSISPDGKKSCHRSEARSDHDGFFHQVKSRHRGISQVTNVNVNIQQQSDDGCAGCFKAIASVFRR